MSPDLPSSQSVSHSSPGMADFVSEAKVLQFQNAFFHFASEKTGVLRAKQMGDVMRKLGQNPTEAELQVNI